LAKTHDSLDELLSLLNDNLLILVGLAKKRGQSQDQSLDFEVFIHVFDILENILEYIFEAAVSFERLSCGILIKPKIHHNALD
jgi:hypothetical protein